MASSVLIVTTGKSKTCKYAWAQWGCGNFARPAAPCFGGTGIIVVRDVYRPYALSHCWRIPHMPEGLAIKGRLLRERSMGARGPVVLETSNFAF